MDVDQTQVVVVNDLEDVADIIFAGEKRPAASLRVLPQNGLAGASYLLYEGDNIIGRNDGTCHVTIPSQSLSKEHACIQILTDIHLIFDKGSRNKTRRGKLVLRPDVRYELRQDDHIFFADIECVYEITEQQCPDEDGNNTEVQATVVLTESDSDDNDVQISQERIVQETLVVEVSDEDSPKDLMGMATQEYIGGEMGKQHGKPSKSFQFREKTRKSPRQRVIVLSSEKPGSSRVRNTGNHGFEEVQATSTRQNFRGSTFRPQQVVDEDGTEASKDATELFAVSTLAYDVSADVVDVDNEDDTDEGSKSDVEIVTKDDKAESSGTVAVPLDATVAVDIHGINVYGKKVFKKAPSYSSASSTKVPATLSTHPLNETVPAENVTTSGTKKRGAKNEDFVSTQIIDATVPLDKDVVSTQIIDATVPLDKDVVSTQILDATVLLDKDVVSTQIIDATVPLDKGECKKVPSKTRNTRGRKGVYDQTNTTTTDETTCSIPSTRSRRQGLQISFHENIRHTHDNTSNKLTLNTVGEVSDKSQTIEKAGSRKKNLRRVSSGARNEQLRQKSDKIILESTQTFSPADSNSTQPYDGDTQETFQNSGDTSTVNGNNETDECSQGHMNDRLLGLPQAYLSSSDDSDIEESSLLKSCHADLNKSDADLTVDKEPTLAYELVPDREPTLAYELVPDREPTLAYELVPDREPTMAYNLTVEEKLERKGQKCRLSLTRGHPENSKNDKNLGLETSVRVTSLPERSPLKSVLVDRRRSPSPANKHVMFAEAVDTEDVNRHAGEGRSVQIPECLPSQVSDSEVVAGSSLRLRRKVLPHPGTDTHKKDDRNMQSDEIGARCSTDKKKRCIVLELEEMNCNNLDRQKKFDVSEQGTISGQQDRACTRDKVDCSLGDDVSLTADPSSQTKEATAAVRKGIKRTTFNMDQEKFGGITTGQEFLQPSNKQGRMATTETAQEVVAITGSGGVKTGRRRKVSDRQHTIARMKLTRRCAHLSETKTETDATERCEMTSVTSSMGDVGTKIDEKLNAGAVTEVEINTRTVREIKKSTNKKDLKKNTVEANVSVASFVRSSRRLISPNLQGRDTKSGQRMDQQEVSVLAACKMEDTTVNNFQGLEIKSIDGLPDPSKNIKAAAQQTVTDPDSYRKKVATRSRKSARMEASDSHIDKPDTNGDMIGVCEVTKFERSGDMTAVCQVTSSEVTPPGKIGQKRVRKPTSSVQREGVEQFNFQQKIEAEPAHAGQGQSMEQSLGAGRGKKRKTIIPETRSKKTIPEESHTSDDHKLGQQDKKAALKLANPSPSSSVLSEVLSPLSSSRKASSNKSRTSPSHTSITSTAGHLGVGRKARKFHATESMMTIADRKIIENSQSSAQLSAIQARRMKTGAAISHDNVLPDTNSSGKVMTQSPSPVKRTKQAVPSPYLHAGKSQVQMSFTPRVMLTGYVDDQAEKVVKELGGEMATSIEDCTHLVTDRICRTVKLLSGLAKGLLIVSRQWLASSKQAGTFLDGELFLVEDTAMEKQYKFDLATSIREAQKNSMLTGYKVHVTASVKPDPTQMKGILIFAGAEYLKNMPRKSHDNTVVISCVDDHDLCLPAIKAGIPVVGAEFILTGILRQERDFESYCLFKDGHATQTPGKGNTRRK